MIYKEIWKPIKDYEKFYEVSNLGNIKSLKSSKKIMKKFEDNLGYLCINLQTNQHKKKKHRVHRLVAQAFIPNINNFPQVNHKDGNKQNNCVDNLEWCTAKYNIIHAYKNGLKKPYWKDKFGINNKNSKQVYKIDINSNKIIKKYNSISDAKRELKIDNSSISKCCKNKQKTAYGYKWRYANENKS